jgi:site-specific recombinase XerD
MNRPKTSGKLLDEVRNTMRARHMSIRTEEAYVRWIREFLQFHKDKRGEWVHPSDLTNAEINQFLTYLAVERKVAANTQNQALSAILFLYSQILKMDVVFDAERAKRPRTSWGMLAASPTESEFPGWQRPK